MRLAVTGHRPDRLGGYSQSTDDRLVTLALIELANLCPDEVHIGMAQGWDMACAEACFALDIPFVAHTVIDQPYRWPPAARVRYATLLALAAREVPHHDYRSRNVALADICDMALALWDGTASGTGQCVQFCEYRSKPVRNVWGVWKNG